MSDKKIYDQEADKSFNGDLKKDKSFNRYSRQATDIVNKHHINGGILPNTNPQPPHTVDYRKPGTVYNTRPSSSKKVTYHRTSEDIKRHGRIKNKKGKLSPAKRFLISAAIVAGGIGAITLGYNLVKENITDSKLAQSQQNLEEMADRETALGNFSAYQTQDNDILILNDNLNDILEKYEQDPSSVSQEEIASLLQSIYTEGKEMVSSKVANAYNAYNQKNNSSITIDANGLRYTHTSRDGNVPYTMAYVNNNNSYVYLPSNEELSDFIASQMDVLSCYGYDGNLVDGVSNEKALDYAKVGATKLNDMVISSFTYEQKFGSPVLVINEAEKESSVNTKTNATNVNAKNNNFDKGDEER